MTHEEDVEHLRTLSVAELISRHRELFGREPRSKNAAFLRKRVAWKLEEARCGGLSQVPRERLETLMRDVEVPREPPASAEARPTACARPPPTRAPPVDCSTPGATIVREWRGQVFHVKVVEGGFEYDGRVHRSLSAVAKAITGAHWNGHLFFGLKDRRKRDFSKTEEV